MPVTLIVQQKSERAKFTFKSEVKFRKAEVMTVNYWVMQHLSENTTSKLAFRKKKKEKKQQTKTNKQKNT